MEESDTKLTSERGVASFSRVPLWSISGFGVVLAAFAALRPAASQTTSTLVCQKWSFQSALSADGNTVFMQGGNARSQPGQSSRTWTNELLSLDVSKDFAVSSAAVSTLSATGNPPAVALGGLYATSDSLYLMGGEFSDTPNETPSPNAVWRYDLAENSWSTASVSGMGQRAAEGAAAIVPSSGSGSAPTAVYAFGHVDSHTDASWSDQTPRSYLSSMQTLVLGSASMQTVTSSAGTAQISTGNASSQSTPAQRADNTITYVPGMGSNGQGILVSIGGGTADTLIDNSSLDVFDLGSQSWARQPTQGSTLSARVNHCAVRGSAEVNGVMQHQIFVFGGQTIGGATLYNDINVLTLPSFTWTTVGSLPNGPSVRAGQSCLLRGSQLLVLGGFLGQTPTCDATPMSVLDTSKMSWASSFNSSAPYQTPLIVANVTGGIGTAQSSSPASSSSPNAVNSGSGEPVASSSSTSQPSPGGSSGTAAGGTSSGDSGSSNGNTGNTPASPGTNVNTGANGGSGSGDMQPQSDASHSGLGTTIGAVVGSLAALALLVVGVLAWRRRRNRRFSAAMAHRRLLSDISNDFSDDGSIISDQSTLVGRRYEDWASKKPFMSVVGGPLRQPYDYASLSYPDRPPVSGASSAYSKLSDDDPTSTAYMASGSGHDVDDTVTARSHGASPYPATPRGVMSADYAFPGAPPVRNIELEQSSGVEADDGHSNATPSRSTSGKTAPSRSTSGKTHVTASSGLDRGLSEWHVQTTYEEEGEAPSPRLMQRPQLFLSNPSASQGSLPLR